jgi:hypothetical protein
MKDFPVAVGATMSALYPSSTPRSTARSKSGNVIGCTMTDPVLEMELRHLFKRIRRELSI